MNRNAFRLVSLVAVALLVACSSYPPKVDCHGKLHAINPPQVSSAAQGEKSYAAASSSGGEHASAGATR